MEPIRVMVVDDASDARFLISLMLGEADGIEVVSEADGADMALAALDEAAPDVALVDARMPAVDGYQLTRMLLECRPDLRVALLTSVVDGVIVAQAREAGAAACWSKADLEGLADQIRELVA
jgi:DNA-binding NarL/FixJ family response regulator